MIDSMRLMGDHKLPSAPNYWPLTQSAVRFRTLDRPSCNDVILSDVSRGA
jgi:hypothetical protein